MDIATKLEHVITNLQTLETYLNSKKEEERAFAHDLIKRSKTILMYKVNGENHFAPSRFCGYQENSIANYKATEAQEEKGKAPKLEKVLKGSARFLPKRETEFIEYCKKLGFDALDHERKYWRVGKTSDPYLDITNY